MCMHLCSLVCLVVSLSLPRLGRLKNGYGIITVAEMRSLAMLQRPGLRALKSKVYDEIPQGKQINFADTSHAKVWHRAQLFPEATVLHVDSLSYQSPLT